MLSRQPPMMVWAPPRSSLHYAELSASIGARLSRHSQRSPSVSNTCLSSLQSLNEKQLTFPSLSGFCIRGVHRVFFEAHGTNSCSGTKPQPKLSSQIRLLRRKKPSDHSFVHHFRIQSVYFYLQQRLRVTLI